MKEVSTKEEKEVDHSLETIQNGSGTIFLDHCRIIGTIQTFDLVRELPGALFSTEILVMPEVNEEILVSLVAVVDRDNFNRTIMVKGILENMKVVMVENEGYGFASGNYGKIKQFKRTKRLWQATIKIQIILF